VGREGESADVREEEADMNLGGEREDSTPISGEIRNLTEEIIPVEANETPQIKEIFPEASDASPESPIPQVPSIQAVSTTLPSHANSVPVQLANQPQPGSASTGRILGSPGRSQEGPLGFILIRTTGSTMASHAGGSIAHTQNFGVREMKTLNNTGSCVKPSGDPEGHRMRTSWSNSRLP
jgi:hypothetical protein